MSAEPSIEPLSQLTDLTGKSAVVTGGATGLGYAITLRLAQAGAFVFIADIDPAAAEEAVNGLKGYGYKAACAKCDVTREDEVRDMVEVAARETGGVDILVNNAGIYPRIPLTQMTAKDFERVLSVNMTGTFLCSRYVCQKMMEQKKGGSIINIASIEALHPAAAEMTAYDASKGGVLMLTKSMARELGRQNIRVNAIAPGGIKTKGMQNVIGITSAEQKKAQFKELKRFMSRMALGRLGAADEVAKVALFLASEMSSYMTGSLVVVDGGYLIS